MQPLANITPLKVAARAGAIEISHVGQVFKTSTQDRSTIRPSGGRLAIACSSSEACSGRMPVSC